MQELAKDTGPDGGVGRGVAHAANQAAEARIRHVGRMAASVAGTVERVGEQAGETFKLGGGGEWLRGGDRLGRLRLRDGVEADSRRLAKIHREMPALRCGCSWGW